MSPTRFKVSTDWNSRELWVRNTDPLYSLYLSTRRLVRKRLAGSRVAVLIGFNMTREKVN